MVIIKLKQARLNLKLRKRQLAALCNLSIMVINNIESKKNIPTARIANKILLAMRSQGLEIDMLKERSKKIHRYNIDTRLYVEPHEEKGMAFVGFFINTKLRAEFKDICNKSNKNMKQILHDLVVDYVANHK